MLEQIFPPTSKRVTIKSDPTVNNDIRNNTISCLDTYKDASADIKTKKIKDLTNEWDIERIVETNSSAIILLASLFGLKRSKWFLLTGVISFFVLQHALQGWCPSLPILRKLRVRTSEEINNEKTVVKMSRGDFDQKPDSAAEMLKLAEME